MRVLPSFPGSARERAIEAPPLVANGARYEFQFQPTLAISRGFATPGGLSTKSENFPGTSVATFADISSNLLWIERIYIFIN